MLTLYLFSLLPSGAVGYYETSALTRAGMSEAVDGLLRAGLNASQRGRRRFKLPWKRWRLNF